MIYEGLAQGSPAPEGVYRRPDLKAGELNELNNCNEEDTKSKSFRRKRMDLRRLRSISREKFAGDPFISPDLNNKKKKFEIEAETENAFVRNDVVSGVVSSHGTLSTIGRRREMEDAVAVELGFMKRGGESFDFFGVYDGHGGWRVARACSEMLHRLVARIVEEERSDQEVIAWEKVMAAAFAEMDCEVNKSGAAVATIGSTAVVAVVGAEHLVVANCGDSRAVLSRAGVAVQLSDDHKPDRADELERIEVIGGKVINWNGARVLGVLATSRSIGDQYLKPFVITDPEVRIVNRSNSDEFLILASDGLWDVISNDVACQITRRCLDGRIRNKRDDDSDQGSDRRQSGESSESRCVRAAAVLVELAMARGSKDNISVIVVDLKNS